VDEFRPRDGEEADTTDAEGEMGEGDAPEIWPGVGGRGREDLRKRDEPGSSKN
jgi:hypothetical protein